MIRGGLLEDFSGFLAEREQLFAWLWLKINTPLLQRYYWLNDVSCVTQPNAPLGCNNTGFYCVMALYTVHMEPYLSVWFNDSILCPCKLLGTHILQFSWYFSSKEMSSAQMMVIKWQTQGPHQLPSAKLEYKPTSFPFLLFWERATMPWESGENGDQIQMIYWKPSRVALGGLSWMLSPQGARLFCWLLAANHLAPFALVHAVSE